MSQDVLAVFIPITMIFGTTAVLITLLYLRHKEKEQILQKDFSAEEVVRLFNTPKKTGRSTALLVIGILSIFFGLALGGAISLEHATDQKHWVPMFIFAGTGLGFVVAHFVKRKVEEADRLKEKNEESL